MHRTIQEVVFPAESVTVMVHLPVPTFVTLPLLSTLATLVSEEDHVKELVEPVTLMV